MSRQPAFSGDGVVVARQRAITVDLWQLLDAEDVTLVESLLSAVDGAALTGADKTVFGCTVENVERLVLPDENICQHSLFLNVFHSN